MTKSAIEAKAARPPGATSILGRAARLGTETLSRLTLVQRFALVSLAVLISGAFIIGRFVADELEADVTARNGAITTLYVDSFVSPQAQGLIDGSIPPAAQRELDSLLTGTALGEDIFSFKIWDTQGSIVYASNRDLVGSRFELGGGLESALGGRVHSSMSDLNEDEHAHERTLRSGLLETYAPIRANDTGIIIGAMEFYQDPGPLEAEIASSQRSGWIVVGVSTLVMYLLLVGLVKGASNTLTKQHRSLRRMAAENGNLATRVREAASQKTETDEELMMRIARDLHDGPAQDLSLALLRMEAVKEGVGAVADGDSTGREQGGEDFAVIETALTNALKEVRQISSDLRLPELANLSLEATVRAAVSGHLSKTGSQVPVDLKDLCPTASLPVKIVVYRVIQEALFNSYRHAPDSRRRVEASCAGGSLELIVLDDGPGFDPGVPLETADRSRLGVRGMRERVEMLGGILEIASSRAKGTTVSMQIPVDEMDDRWMTR